MANVILQPAGGGESRKHYIDTVVNPVAFSQLASYMSSREVAVLKAATQADTICAWGMVPSNESRWELIQPGDTVLFSGAKHFYSVSTVVGKLHNRQLATLYWGTASSGKTWEYMYFFLPPVDINIPYEQFNRSIPYEPDYAHYRVNVLRDNKAEAALKIIYGQTPPISIQETTRFKDYREGFINYLTEILKMSESSINVYINSLETASKTLISRGLSNSGIFSISSSNEAETLLNSYLSQDDLNESNFNSHRRVSAGWNHLINYLSRKNIRVKVKVTKIKSNHDLVKELESVEKPDGSVVERASYERTEPELALQKSFEEILTMEGLNPYSKKFEVMGTSKNISVLMNDIFLDEVNFLIEAKIYTRENVRMVIGQIKDYARYCEPYPNCATLLSGKPSGELIDLLLKQDIYCIWKNSSNNSFEDNIPEGMLFS